MQNKFNPDGVMNNITDSISRKLNEIGIMYRIFSRSKSEQSLLKKLESNKNYGKTKKTTRSHWYTYSFIL